MCNCEERFEISQMYVDDLEKRCRHKSIIIAILAFLLLVSVVYIIFKTYDDSQFDVIYYATQDTATGDNKIIISKEGVDYGGTENNDKD